MLILFEPKFWPKVIHNVPLQGQDGPELWAERSLHMLLVVGRRGLGDRWEIP